ASGAVALAHGFGNIGDAGSFVLEDQLDALDAAVAHGAPMHYASSSILVDVTGKLGRGSDDAGRFGRVESNPRGDIAHGTPRDDNVGFCSDGNFTDFMAVDHDAPSSLSRSAMSNARSTVSAVRVAPSVKPSCVAAIATAGFMPAMIVSPPMRVIIAAVSATVRAK